MRPEYRLLPFESKHVEFLLKEVDTRDLLAQCAGTTFSFPLTKGEIISYLEKDTIYPFVLTEQDSILGYGDLLIEPDREIRLCRLLIGKAHRHKGLGKILVQRMVEKAKTLEATLPIRLFVLENNPSALACYLKCHFQTIPFSGVLPGSDPPIALIKMEYHED